MFHLFQATTCRNGKKGQAEISPKVSEAYMTAPYPETRPPASLLGAQQRVQIRMTPPGRTRYFTSGAARQIPTPWFALVC